MNGMSSGMLANTHSLVQAAPSRSAVSSAARLIVWPIRMTASMLMPARVEATLTEAHTRSVVERASGMASIRARSPRAMPFSTRAEKPPMKSTLISRATASRVCANSTISAGESAAPTTAMGLTATRLLTTGMPYFWPMRSQTGTSSPARRQMRSATRCRTWVRSDPAQSSRLTPSVTVRTSRFSFLSISRVETISR